MTPTCTRFERKIRLIITLTFVVRIYVDLIYLTELCQNFEFQPKRISLRNILHDLNASSSTNRESKPISYGPYYEGGFKMVQDGTVSSGKTY